MRLSGPSAIVAAALIALCATACSQGPRLTEVEAGGKLSSVDRSSAPEPSDPTAVGDYFRKLATNDPGELAAAERLASPGSVAAAYARHLGAVTRAALDGGTPYAAQGVTKSKEGYRSCSAGSSTSRGEPCVVWGDVRTKHGRVASFTVGGKALGPRMVLGNRRSVKAGGLATVRFVSAYLSAQSEALFVTLEVRSRDTAIELGSYAARYRPPGGRWVRATMAVGRTNLGARSTGYVVVVFEKAPPGGRVSLDVSDADFNRARTVAVTVR